MIGSLGPGTKLPSLGHVEFDELHAAYLEQARGLMDGGVDALLVETVYDLLQGKAAILACKDALAEFKSDTPLFATVTIETTGQMLVGSEIQRGVHCTVAAWSGWHRSQLREPARISCMSRCATSPEAPTRPCSARPTPDCPGPRTGR